MESFLGLIGTLGLLGLGSSLGTGIAGMAQQSEMNDKALELSEKQFDANLAWQREQLASQQAWLESMSNTAHQREVKDLLAAGLNPILSATGGNGASTPGAPSPTGLTPNQPHLFDPSVAWTNLQRNVSSALDSYTTNYERVARGAQALAMAEQTETLTEPMKERLQAETGRAVASASALNADIGRLQRLSDAQVSFLENSAINQREQSRQTAAMTAPRVDQIRADIRASDARAGLDTAQARATDAYVQPNIMRLRSEVRRNESDVSRNQSALDVNASQATLNRAAASHLGHKQNFDWWKFGTDNLFRTLAFGKSFIK